MIGKIDFNRPKVVVLGGGISGLIAAYLLSRKGMQVELHEKSARLGGLIKTESVIDPESKKKIGIAESAAHSLLLTEEVAWLFKELELAPLGVNADSKARFIFRNGKMRKFPLTFFETLELVCRVLFVLGSSKTENLEQWGLRHLGKGATNNLLAPFVNGVFGSALSDLSIEAAFPVLVVSPKQSLFLKMLSRRKSKQKNKMVSLLGGMQSLVDALAFKLANAPNVKIHLDSEIQSLDSFSNVNVVVSVPAPVAAELMKDKSASTAQSLSELEYASLISVTVLIEKQDIARVPKGVGVLRSKEDQAMKCLGVLFNSSAFEGRVEDASKMISLMIVMYAPQEKTSLMSVIKSDLSLLFGVQPNANLILKDERVEKRHSKV